MQLDVRMSTNLTIIYFGGKGVSGTDVDDGFSSNF